MNSVVSLEELSDEEIEQLHKQFQKLGKYYPKLTDTVEEDEMVEFKSLPRRKMTEIKINRDDSIAICLFKGFSLLKNSPNTSTTKKEIYEEKRYDNKFR